MKLKSFGCSFIFGSDLSDQEPNLVVPVPSQHTWPALLAKHMNYEYECLARPGSGNLQIAEKILNHLVTNNDTDFVVVGWTWIDRFDYNDSALSTDPVTSHWNNWKTLLPSDQSSTAQNYYKNLHSEFRDKLVSVMYIKLVIDTLRQREIPFLMTYMDPLLFDQRWNVTDAVKQLQNSVEPFMTTFEGQTFLDWCRQKQFEISAAWHPLERAHQAACDYMIKVFDKQKTSGPAQQVRV